MDQEVIFTRVRNVCPNPECACARWYPIKAPRKEVRELEGLCVILERVRAEIHAGKFDPRTN